MATVTKGKTFISGETVEPADMHQLVDSATVTDIVDADIGSGAAIAASKLAATLDLSSKTVTLPDASVASAKIADAAVTAAKLNGAQTGSAPIYGCRAWVNFDGTAGSTVDGEFRCTIRASGNVSKVVRAATGRYSVHFTTALPSADYAVCGMMRTGGTTDANAYNDLWLQVTQTTAVAAIGVSGGWSVNSASNSPLITLTFFA